MTDEKRYAVTIGLSVSYADAQSFSDFGVRYGNLRYADMVGVEAVVAKHKAALDTAMEPILADLVALGLAQASIIDPEHAKRLDAMFGKSTSSRSSR